mmetsp:Transcript_18709/g.26083  ORF Transcript_18709/g.26083 Transcript_18709/m.26083 type:complete len:194 (-) Transcript_18709:224-805(-)|eukprot:CAMPEP_0184477952 /NCGR_PEP_ID=MMETSP0113_2-20130426/90_1 /TAXON_ID=91329 /ORGANISM="Norrisiella sphaerica, Strain BC52" /LENGTH=193 /DNA_ID=CAMNT_0026855571 /DNA_START=190 /DNA_END=771 /DNA_ORIENTATION=+
MQSAKPSEAKNKDTIIVALHGEEQTNTVLEWCATHLPQEGKKVIFAHVCEWNPAPEIAKEKNCIGLDIDALNLALRKQAIGTGTKFLHECAKKGRAMGIVPDEMKLLESTESLSPKRALLQYTQQILPILLVCGSRGLNPTGRITIGSVSDFLMHNVACTVMVVRTRKIYRAKKKKKISKLVSKENVESLVSA